MGNNTAIRKILLKQRDKLHKELLSDPKYVDLIEIDEFIKGLKTGNAEIEHDKPEKEYPPLKTEVVGVVNQSTVDYGTNNDGNNDVVLDHEFPTSGRRYRGKQIKYVVSEANMAISKKEIQRRLKEKAGITANIREALKRSINKGELLYVKFNSSQRYAFVALPEWIETQNNGKEILERAYSPPITELPKNLNYKNQDIDRRIK